MTTLQLLIVALVQGITEFLPVSSSGHLILIPVLSGWPDQGLAFDVAAHLGTLFAVVGYFRRDLVRLSVDWAQSLLQRRLVGEAGIAWAVLFGTIPVGLVGLAAHDFIAGNLRSAAVIAITTVVFGVLLWWADARGTKQRELGSINARDVLLIGCAQALALIPGTSRSGITMSAALLLGLSRDAAARFSFLLSIPVIVLASGLEIRELVELGGSQPWAQLGVVTALSAVSAYACIHLFLSFIGRMGMAPFALYRFALGAVFMVAGGVKRGAYATYSWLSSPTDRTNDLEVIDGQSDNLGRNSRHWYVVRCRWSDRDRARQACRGNLCQR